MAALLLLTILYIGYLQSKSPPPKEEDLMIADLCAESERYIGNVVTLQGFFQGWQVVQCQFLEGIANTPRTRSDWLIRTGNDCVYVTGGMPEDFDPMNPENLGLRIELNAKVMQDEDKKIYLTFRNSRRL